MRLMLTCCFALAWVGCTTDEPGPKQCEPGSTDPELQCVAGYVCDCKPEGCYCVKKAGLVVVPRTDLDDPYLRLLRRVGAFDPPGNRQ